MLCNCFLTPRATFFLTEDDGIFIFDLAWLHALIFYMWESVIAATAAQSQRSTYLVQMQSGFRAAFTYKYAERRKRYGYFVLYSINFGTPATKGLRLVAAAHQIYPKIRFPHFMIICLECL